MLTFGPMDEAAARAVLGWRYPPPYDLYNADPAGVGEGLATLLDPANACFAARDADGALVGYCCFGPEARVPGGDYGEAGLTDLGLGLRPDLTGRGLGAAFVAAATTFGRERLGARRYRLTVAAFNQRAIRVYARAGFREVARFRRGGRADGLEFVIMREDA